MPLPVSLSSARRATRWVMTHFGGSIRTATDGTPFSPALLCGIICQETAWAWLNAAASGGFTPDQVLAACVLDGSGDAPGSSRRAFPRNTAAFYARYDRAFGDMLVAESNKGRAMRGFGPKNWIYKGYGIFQYDLQFVTEGEDYFRFRQWHDFGICLNRVMKELTSIHRRNGGNLWETVRAYNGGGQAARSYRDNVKRYTAAAQAEIDTMGGSRSVPAVPGSPEVLPATQFDSLEEPPAVRSKARAALLPKSKPQLTQSGLAQKLKVHDIDRAKHPLIVVGIRAYYRDTMGAPGVNDRGMYDDALFIESPAAFAAYNGNTDPSRVRAGHGTAEATKGMAVLDPGLWMVHKFDKHNGQYLALCQRAGKVTVTRDGKKVNYKDTGEFGINIHRGSYHGTSSLGCQTVHPDQWDSFIHLAVDLARRYHGSSWKDTVIPYVLLEA